MASKEIKEYWELVADIGCIVSGLQYGIQLHHCKGGSIKDLGIYSGIGRKNSDWLVIPLNYHYHIGDMGIHKIGVRTWEEEFGTQVWLINRLIERTGIDVWDRAKIKI